MAGFISMRLKNLARKMGITIYQVEKILLDDYMVEQMRNPSVMFGMK